MFLSERAIGLRMDNYDKEWNMNNFVFEKEKKREIDNIDYDKLKFEKKNNNKFIEFIAITPGVIRFNTKFSLKLEKN